MCRFIYTAHAAFGRRYLGTVGWQSGSATRISPCIVKLPHALLVPAVQMYTLEPNQTAVLTLCHEIRTSSPLWCPPSTSHPPKKNPANAHTAKTVACVPVARFDVTPSIHREPLPYCINCNIWPRRQSVFFCGGLPDEPCAREGTRVTEHCFYWASPLIERRV